MSLAIAMIIAYIPFLIWVIREAIKESKEADNPKRRYNEDL